ncbi:MAG: hypothetical protein C4290_15160 [Chloroflexota bacterium]
MERILVPLDGSALSEHAVPVAARLARALEAAVILLRVVPPPKEPVPPTAGDLPPLVDLEERQEPAFAGRPVERVVLVGLHPAEEIITWMRAHPVDFVVMATHGHGGLRHLVTGSVTEAVLRSGLAPVIAVRPVPTSSATRR